MYLLLESLVIAGHAEIVTTVDQSAIRGLVPHEIIRQGLPHSTNERTHLSRLRAQGWVEELGKGGMGIVYRVHDAELNRDLALKVMHAKYQSDASMRRRFIEEARVTGQLQYPSIPPAFERGELPDGRLYYTMKLVQGRTLHELLRARPNPAHEAAQFLSIFEKVAEAVAYAHSKHVLHRDLKPSNIMVGRFKEVQVMDWGASKVLVAQSPERPAEISPASVVRTVRTSESGPDTQAGSAIGTYAYMPPEQAEGDVEKVDERADVFALGSILCELLTGKPAYTGRDSDEVRRKAMRGDLSEARERLESCGAESDLVSLAMECLAAEPHDRLNDAAIVADRIAAHINAVEERLEAAKLGALPPRLRRRKSENAVGWRSARWPRDCSSSPLPGP